MMPSNKEVFMVVLVKEGFIHVLIIGIANTMKYPAKRYVPVAEMQKTAPNSLFVVGRSHVGEVHEAFPRASIVIPSYNTTKHIPELTAVDA
tara:strand:+ start:312 stop:584 length:273 start_codon:yes stop_codon:yes gene_type:complete